MKRKTLIGMIVLAAVIMASDPVHGQYCHTIWDESFHYEPSDSGLYLNWVTQPELHGLPIDYVWVKHEYGSGLRLKNVYLRWNLYEKDGDNQWNQDYIQQKKMEIQFLREKGFSIILRINPSPVPTWYKDLDAGERHYFRNQYVSDGGDPMVPAGLNFPWDRDKYGLLREGNGTMSLVSFWHRDYEEQVGDYLRNVFETLGNNFFAVYIAVGKWGEADFPDAGDYHGHDNCYWAYDYYAQQDLQNNHPELTGFMPATCSGTGERTVNGDFEDDLYPDTIANWGSTYACYQLAGWQPQVVEAADAPRGLSRVLQYSGPSFVSGQEAALRQEIVIQPDTEYILSGWVKSMDADTKACMRLVQMDREWRILEGETVSLESREVNWQEVSAEFRSTTMTARAYVDLYLQQDHNNASTVYFEDISVLDKLQPVADHSQAALFLEWYYGRLIEAINWQIACIKKYYDGRLILMEGGYAARNGDIEAEINNDLSGLTRNYRWVCRGIAPDRYLAGLTDKQNIYFAYTAVEQKNKGHDIDGSPLPAWDDSPLQSDWSMAKYFAYLADKHGLKLWSENTGDSFVTPVDMDNAFANVHAYGYQGLGWKDAPALLYAPGKANLEDLERNIFQYGGITEPEGFAEEFTAPANTSPPAWSTASVEIKCLPGGSDSIGRFQLQGATSGEACSPEATSLNIREYFDSVEIKIDAISPGLSLDLGLRDKQGRYFWARTGLDSAGIYRLKMPAWTFEAGVVDLGVFRWVLRLQGPVGGQADLDYIRLLKTSASPAGFYEPFLGNGEAGCLPAGWCDHTLDNGFGALLVCDPAGGGRGIFSCTDYQSKTLPDDSILYFGKVHSPLIRNLDINQFGALEMKVADVDENTWLDVGITELDKNNNYTI
ncbi:hypothetical protein JW933_03145, partial [candidate division FCPU426 bacterium]|nr:hypothetical protein [candidate division FCPU426 bacterium]